MDIHRDIALCGGRRDGRAPAESCASARGVVERGDDRAVTGSARTAPGDGTLGGCRPARATDPRAPEYRRAADRATGGAARSRPPGADRDKPGRTPDVGRAPGRREAPAD